MHRRTSLRTHLPPCASPHRRQTKNNSQQKRRKSRNITQVQTLLSIPVWRDVSKVYAASQPRSHAAPLPRSLHQHHHSTTTAPPPPPPSALHSLPRFYTSSSPCSAPASQTSRGGGGRNTASRNKVSPSKRLSRSSDQAWLGFWGVRASERVSLCELKPARLSVCLHCAAVCSPPCLGSPGCLVAV